MTAIVIPVKHLSVAKGRLRNVLGPDQRRRLVLAMLTDLLTVLQESSVEDVWLVTGDEDVASAVDGFKVQVLVEDGIFGYNNAVVRGLAAITAGSPVAILPADIPLVTPDEIALLACCNNASNAVVRIAPDRHGRGTNGLYLSSPDLIAPAFGENSFFHHGVAAGRAGADVIALELPKLAIDIDGLNDLELLKQNCKGGATEEFLLTLRNSAFRTTSFKVGAT